MFYEQLCKLLAGGNTELVQYTRVRAALGATHSSFVYTQPEDDKEIVRKAALEAAFGALGLPGPLR